MINWNGLIAWSILISYRETDLSLRLLFLGKSLCFFPFCFCSSVCEWKREYVFLFLLFFLIFRGQLAVCCVCVGVVGIRQGIHFACRGPAASKASNKWNGWGWFVFRLDAGRGASMGKFSWLRILWSGQQQLATVQYSPFWRRNGRIQQLFHCGTVVFRISNQPKFVDRV